MTLSWYVLHSKPNREDFLYSQLRYRELEAYYPCLHVKPVNPRSKKHRPFFPGYIFVHVDLDHTPLSSLTWVPGANRVVSFDYEPAIVPDDVMTALKENVSAINAKGGDPHGGLKPGDPVEIKSGPFKGYQAIFDMALDGSERVRLLIKLMRDRQVRVQVPEGWVQPKK